MKNRLNIIFLLVVLFAAFGCKNKTKPNNKEANNKKEKISSKRIANYNCANFFTKGDYSALCISDGKLPYITTKENGAKEIHCSYILTKDSVPTRDAVKVSFSSFGNTKAASKAFKMGRENTKENKTEFKIRDAEAYIITASSNNGKNNVKRLWFNYKNVMINISIAYYKPWIKTMPCFYSDNELKMLAELVYDNIKEE